MYTNLIINDEGVYDVVIPKSVKTIGAYAFCGSQIASVTIVNGVTSIGRSAFSSCYNLREVSIPASVEYIGGGAFSSCPELTTADFASVKALCEIEFESAWSNPISYARKLIIGGEEITDLSIPGSIESIGNYTFYNCEGLTSVSIPSSVKSIGIATFSYCQGLTSITIPSSLKSIGRGAFEGCTGITKAEYESVESLCGIEFGPNGNPLLYSSDPHLYIAGQEVTEVTIPESVTAINGTFAGAQSLTSVTIPNSVTSIGDQAFLGCTSLASISIPTSVTEIGSGAFNWCTSLPSINIPSSVKSIKSGAFYGCKSITSIIIPNSVTELGGSALGYCTSLEDITLSSNIKEIGSYTFTDCTALKEIILPPNVEAIGSAAFWNCTELSNIVIGPNVKTIGHQTFIGTKAETVSITASTPPEINSNVLFSDYSGKLYVQDEAAAKLYAEAPFWSNFTPSVMAVAQEMEGDTDVDFSGKKGDQIQLIATIEPADVSLPQIFWRSTNTDIATVDADGLVTLQMDLSSAAAQTIKEDALSCKILAETLYADGPMLEYTVIDTQDEEGYDFSYEYAGQTLVYTVVDADAKTVRTKSGRSFNPGNTVSGALIIPEKVKDIARNIEFTVAYIGDYSFNDCTELTAVTLPNTITEIGTRAFIGCEKLSAATIPNSVTKIGYEAYNKCTALASVVIPSSVTEIGNYAFNECDNLTSVYYDSEDPLACERNIFSDTAYGNATLYVPESAVDVFKATDPWLYFNNIEAYEFSGIENIAADNGGEIDYNSPYEVYNLSGRTAGSNIEGLTPGMYIIRQGKTVKKIIIK